MTRAVDEGGAVFESSGSKTMAEALAALEKGLAKWFKGQGIEAE